MKTFSFEPGVHLRIAGIRYMIVAALAEGDGFTLVDQAVGTARDWKLEELEARLTSGTLEYDPPISIDAAGKPRPAKRSEPLSSMKATDRTRVEFRLKVLRAVEALQPGSLFETITYTDHKTGLDVETTLIEHTIDETCRCAGRKPVCLATYYNWKKSFGEHEDVSDLRGEFARRGRKAYLDPLVSQKLKEVLHGHVELAKSRAVAGVYRKLTPSQIRSDLGAALPADKALPSLSSIARGIEQLSAYDRAVVKSGVRKADNQFRAASAIERPRVCLDRVEYDETRLRLLVIDEIFGGLPLGIPYLSWYVDSVSHVPLGFYVGFEPMSDVSTMAALRHACLPKAYIRTEYPSIKGRLLGGVPRGVVFDNGLTQHGDTIAEVGADLGFDYVFAPPYSPWFKSAVENMHNMHNMLNDLLLSDLPGFNIDPRLRPDDYDPKVNACIGLRHFLFLLHKWLADRYMLTGTGFLSLRPIDHWEAGTDRVKPRFVASTRDLDLTFGILRRGNLDHRGVRFEDLFYIGEDQAPYRRLHGASIEVDVKVNATDLGAIYWRGPDKLWRRAVAKLRDYAAGRGLQQHILIKAAARVRYNSIEPDALKAADRDIRELGRAGLESAAIGLRQNEKIARAFGVGSDHLIGSQRHDGSLGPATGIYAGLPLNPFSDREAATPTPDEPRPVVEEVPATRAAPVRARPRFHVERYGDDQPAR